MVVVSESSGFFKGSHFHYLVPYRGLTFYARSATALSLPGDAEVIRARKIAIPSL